MTIMYTTPVYQTTVPADIAQWLTADYSSAFGYAGNDLIEITDLSAALNISNDFVEVYEDGDSLYLCVADILYPFSEA